MSGYGNAKQSPFDPRGGITAPEPELTAGQIVSRARALVPYIRLQAPLMEKQRRISDEMNRKFMDAGFYRILQPRRFGGYEFDLETFVAVMVEIARGDGSAGWVLTFNAAHNYFATFFAEAAQLEMYGDDGDCRWPLIYQATGSARKVDGGYLVNGAWDYASGIQISNWLGVVCTQGDRESQPPALRMMAMRASEISFDDNWQTLGLRGTGSLRVIARDVFVPEHRALSLDALAARLDVPGYGTVDNPFYRTPDLPVFFLEIACVAVGLARASIDVLMEYAQQKKQAYPPFTALHKSEKIHRRLADATATADAAEALLYHLARQQMNRSKRVDDADGFPDVELRRAGIDAQKAVELSFEAVQTVFLSAGSSGARNGSPLERIYRDISMLRTHYLMDHDRTWRNWGALAFGHPAPEAM